MKRPFFLFITRNLIFILPLILYQELPSVPRSPNWMENPTSPGPR